MSYKSYFMHAGGGNPNHDPKTGQFTFSTSANVAKQGREIVNNTTRIVDKFSKEKKKPRANLSNLSDQELHDILNREEMERRYDTYFNTPTEKAGAKKVKDVLDIVGAGAGIIVAGLTAAGLIAALANNTKKKGN